MSDTCPKCGTFYAVYQEGHSPDSPTCLAIQLKSIRKSLKATPTSKEQEYRTLLEQAMDTMSSKIVAVPLRRAKALGEQQFQCPECGVAQRDSPVTVHLSTCWFTRVQKALARE